MSLLFRFCNAGFKTTTRIFADQEVEGRENIPDTGPLIFIANHLSNLDPAIVASLTGRAPSFLAKEELFKFPLFDYLLRKYGAHPLNRGRVGASSIKWATRRLRDPKGALILFPEGTRNKRGDGMRKGLPGVTRIALQNGVPIVPIGLTGTEPLQNVLKVFVPRSKQRIKIGKPFRLNESVTRRPSRDELEVMTTEIMVRVARLLPEVHHGHYREQMDIPFVYTAEINAALEQPVSAPAT